MRNYIQPGDSITVIAEAEATSGDIIKLGNLVGVASGAAAIGEPLVLTTTGVFELPKVSTDALAIGDAVYFRTSDSTITSTASGNTKIGVAVAAAGNPSGSVRVRLNGTF
jgi:predicted RecA/RadA family phage recombinase